MQEFFYHIVILKRNSPLLTYSSKTPLEKGSLVSITLLSKTLQGMVLKECQKPEFKCKEATPLEFHFSQAQCDLAEFIASYYCTSRSLAFSLFTPFDNTHKTELKPLDFPLNPLSTKQLEAFTFITKRQDSLIFGDTGSGKTEIYMHLFNQSIKKGKNALFLMPEISLTPQMEKRLKAVFGDCIAFWHSKITKSKKHKILQDLKEGKVRILAGARSALFLPLVNLDLIIIDEEHDDAYKSSSTPRYHARNVALYLAKTQNIKIVLGSATPLATSYQRAKKNNNLFRLKGTHFDTQKHYHFCQSAESIEPTILSALQKNLENGKQAIVFLPTRANFKHLLCIQCKEAIECPNCSVSLSLHTKDSSLKCHYCHYTRPIPTACPKCKGTLQTLRIGTQEFAKVLQESLPQSRIACFDRDSITTQKKLTQTLDAFNRHTIDVLVGTQMLSKGHDYHNVALSVALGLDYILKGNDYRARERALALMFQLSGRSGRKENGEVLIQTLYPDFFQHYLQDYQAFLEDELKMRGDLYPPFVRLALICFNHKNQTEAQNLTQKALGILTEQIQENSLSVEIVGSGEAPIERILDKWRYLIMLRSPKAKDLHIALLPLRNFACEIDIDPIEFN
ncbi:primosomal protein N' [Helicobacter turcicus]|uniref:Replication restart protein PriA n=1 Tax=Helicobacter turcicus TaxID=2867412 RepID=A0ABS7JP21_9HELI|nr:primosomal protein N' [Helicobacter turcicus]MBX7491115.1 primosomal protein N' [Helicobacter turcicus]MBX7545979.1 primosomal protein N' [Helicobacter turcicus]